MTGCHGWLGYLPDHRDLLLRARPQRPPRLDLSTRGHLPRVENQGPLEDCVLNAATSAMEYLYLRDGKVVQFSRLFAWYATRVWIEKEPPTQNVGVYVRDAMRALVAFGCCLESTWPYEVSRFSVRPSEDAVKEARLRRVVNFLRCDGLDAIKTSISDGYPVVGGFSVPATFDGASTTATGIVAYPSSSKTPIVGAHGVLFVGYDDDKQRLKFENSYGRHWGDHGFGYLPYEFVERGLAADFQTVRSVRSEDGA